MSIQGTGRNSPTSPSQNRQRSNSPIFSVSLPESSRGDYFFRCETNDLIQEIARLSPVPASHEASQKNASQDNLNSTRSQPQMSVQPQASTQDQASESHSDDDRKKPAKRRKLNTDAPSIEELKQLASQFDLLVIPEERISELGENDVLLGNGGAGANRDANIRYRKFLRDYLKEDYRESDKNQRDLIISGIFVHLDSKGFRFFQEQYSNQEITYRRIDKKSMRTKIGDFFRNIRPSREGKKNQHRNDK
jgi:hypothetical protein